MFGSKRRKNLRTLNRVSWDHALRIELLEIKLKALEGKEVTVTDGRTSTISPPT